MPQNLPLLSIGATVTQGSADAFAEAEINTGLQSATNIAYRVKRIFFFMPTTLPGADSDLDICLNRKSSTSNLAISSRANIVRVKRTQELTTSGMSLQEQPWVFEYLDEDNLLIVEDPLYLTVDSTSTSAANTAQVKIFYQQVSIKELDRLAIIANYSNA